MKQFVLAIALASDALAISFTLGLINNSSKNKKDGLKSSFLFGFFQSLMFAIGCLFSIYLYGHIANYINIISFLSLFIVASNFLKEFLSFDKEDNINLTSSIIILSIVSSIDALISGVGTIGNTISYIDLIIIIFLVTFILCLIGYNIASRLKHIKIIQRYSILFGAIILYTLSFLSLF